MAQKFSVDQLKLNTYMLTGSTEGLFFDSKQLAFGTDAVSTSRQIIAGVGLGGGGTLASDVTLTLNVDNSTVEIDTDTLRVKAGGIENSHLAGSIDNSKLSNSFININQDAGITGASSVSLGGTLNLGVNVDGSSLEIVGDQVKVKDLGITNSHLANDTIQNAKLLNDSVNLNFGEGLTGDSSVALGGTLSVAAKVDDSTIEIDTDTFRVKDLGITNAKLAGSITNAKLSNSAVTVTAGDGLKDGGAVSLGGSVSLNIDVSDFAGDGLADDGSENLKVDNSVLRTTGGQTISDPGSDPSLAIEGTLSVKDLSVTGTLTKISTQDLVVTDNIITLNTGDPGLTNGTGISLGVAGIEIWRGTGDWGPGAGQQTAGYDGDGADRAQLFYNDNPGKDYWEAGLENDMAKILLDKNSHTGWLANSDDVNTVAANLVTTGQTLWDRDLAISGDLDAKIGSNVGQTATNTSNIATNTTNITNLTNNKVDKTIKVIAGSGLTSDFATTLDTDVTLDVKGGQGITVEDDLVKISNGDVTNAMLANSAVSFGGISVSLGGSDDTPQLNLTDATGYKASSIEGTLTNSQLQNNSISVIPDAALTGDSSVSLGGTLHLGVAVDDHTIEVNSSDQLRVKGNIANAHLTNSSLTVNAGDGLDGGGSISLGGSATINVDNTVVRTAGNQVIGGMKAFEGTGFFSQDLLVGGNLTVSGTTTVVHSTEVDVGDRIIKLQADLGAGVAATLDAGFEVNRGSSPLVQLLWNESNDYWTATNAAGTAYEILTKEKVLRNTVSLGVQNSASVAFGHTFAGLPSVTVSVQGVDETADVVSAQLAQCYTTGFVVSFSTTLTGNYKLHYIASDA